MGRLLRNAWLVSIYSPIQRSSYVRLAGMPIGNGRCLVRDVVGKEWEKRHADDTCLSWSVRKADMLTERPKAVGFDHLGWTSVLKAVPR
ncbi:MAG: hypothetical protein LZF86_80112 [Nitrospira sp.]|nr:MAG: hypothetical protein LZF86_80112 [Nitrospira sp.]